MSNKGAPLTGVVKIGGCGIGTFILTVAMGEGAEVDLSIQDHMSLGRSYEGKKVDLLVDTVEGVCVLRSIDELIDAPFDPDATVAFSSKLYKKGDVQGATFEMAAGVVDPSSVSAFKNFIKQAEAHLGIKVIDEDKVISKEANDD